MTEKELLQDIYDIYRSRYYSQYDLAKEYDVSTVKISFLLTSIGFTRGKLVNEKPLDEVLQEKEVKNILNKMLANKKLVSESKQQIPHDDTKDLTFFVNDAIYAIKKLGWEKIEWEDFAKIPTSEYEQYIEIIKLLMPPNSELFYELKHDFDGDLSNDKQKYEYLCRLIGSIAYVDESGFYGTEREDSHEMF